MVLISTPEASANTRRYTLQPAMPGRGAAKVVVDTPLKSGADETILNDDGETAADVVDTSIVDENPLAENVERVRQLLMNAPADRAWRRRDYWCYAASTLTGCSLSSRVHLPTWHGELAAVLSLRGQKQVAAIPPKEAMR